MEKHGRNPYKLSELPFWFNDEYNLDEYIGEYYSNHKPKLKIDLTENHLADEYNRDWSIMDIPDQKHYSSAKILKTWEELYKEQRDSIPNYNQDGTFFGKEYYFEPSNNLHTFNTNSKILSHNHSFGVQQISKIGIDRSSSAAFLTPQKQFISKSGSMVRPFREKTNQKQLDQDQRDREIKEQMNEIENKLKKMNQI